MAGLHGEIIKERRLMDVIALFVPVINVAGARWNLVPLWVLPGKIAIKFAKRFGRERGLHDLPDFVERWPEIAQKGFFAVFVFPDRFVREIDMHSTSERK